MLSIFTGPSSQRSGWGSLLFEAEADVHDRSEQHTPQGDRLKMQLVAPNCFPSAASGEDGLLVCVQIADLTQFGRHVRYVNRGCGLLQRTATSSEIILNDGALLALDVVFS